MAVNTSVDMRLAQKGRGVPRAALAEQVGASAALAKEFSTELAAVGWQAADTTAFVALGAELADQNSVQAEALATKEGHTRTEHQEIDQAKELVAKVSLLAPVVITENPQLKVSERDFQRGRLGRSTKTILDYFDRVLPAVEKLDGPFAKYFGGGKASDAVKARKAALATADGTQETALKTAPLETLGFYEKKGRALEMVEKLNRVGKVAFYRQPEIRARFNKSVLSRGRAAAAAPAAAPQ